jgi:hypothetical protein
MAAFSVTCMSTTKLIELLSREAEQGKAFVQVNAEGNVVLGPDPYQPTAMIDFRDEVVRPLQQAKAAVRAAPTPVARHPRQSGKYLVDVKGTTTVCHSLHEALAVGLRALEAQRPGSLERLSQVKPRTKRIVAREPSDLFDDQDLVENYARELMPGWWYGANNSAAETRSWLQRGCELAQLTWGKDFTVDF